MKFKRERKKWHISRLLSVKCSSYDFQKTTCVHYSGEDFERYNILHPIILLLIEFE